MLFQLIRIALLSMLLSLSHLALAEEEKQLNIYNWSDYITPETIAGFEKETGIKVQYDVYDSNQLLESKLMAGKTGYDIVVPTASPFMVRQLKQKLYRELDKSQLQGYGNLDPVIMQKLAMQDPDNAHAIPWMWGTVGTGYNVKKIKEIMPDAPVNSLKMFFDRAIAAKFASCGIGMLDSATDIIPNALVYAGLDPNSHKKEDLDKAEAVLMAVRPYIRQFHSSKYIDDLANGDLCLVLGFSGDILQASNRAKEAKNGVVVNYVIPQEGAQIWIDAMVILGDAKHPNNAHKFLSYILRPEVVAANTNFIGYANGNSKALPLVKDSIRKNPQVYPTAEMMGHLYTIEPSDASYDRLRTRSWTRIVSGK